MEILLTVCAVLLMVALGFITVHLVLALQQLRRTLASVEELSLKLNTEMEKVQTVTNMVSTVAGAFSGTMGRSAALAFNLVKGLMKGRGGKSAEGDGSPEPGHKAQE